LNVEQNKIVWVRVEKWPVDNIFRPDLGGVEEYSGGWCMIYGLLGDCVCCSRVACPMSDRERPPSASPTFDQGDKAVNYRFYEDN